jgi:hypothetical protein
VAKAVNDEDNGIGKEHAEALVAAEPGDVVADQREPAGEGIDHEIHAREGRDRRPNLEGTPGSCRRTTE